MSYSHSITYCRPSPSNEVAAGRSPTNLMHYENLKSRILERKINLSSLGNCSLGKPEAGCTEKLCLRPQINDENYSKDEVSLRFFRCEAICDINKRENILETFLTRRQNANPPHPRIDRMRKKPIQLGKVIV